MAEPVPVVATHVHNRTVDARVALVYAFVAGLWIVASDRLLPLYVAPDDVARFSIYKGLAFVALTSLLLYGLLRYVSHGALTHAPQAVPDGRSFRRGTAYAVAAALTLLALVLRESLPPEHAVRSVMIVFLLPVAIGALLGGQGPGLLATALTTVGMLVSDMASIDLGAEPPQIAAQLTRLGLFVLMGIGFSFVCEALHVARRRAESLLGAQQRLNAEYRLLAEQLPDFVWRKDRAGRYVGCNSRFAEVTGRTVAEVVGRTEHELSFAEDAERWNAEDAHIAATGETLEREQFWRTPHSDVGWVLVTKSPVLDDQGHCIGIIGVARDVTSRRAADEALRASERYLNALFVESIDAMVTFSLPPEGLPGRFIDVNPAAERLLGQSREALLQIGPTEVLPQLQAAALGTLADRLREAGHLRTEVQLDTAEGAKVPVDVSVTLVLQQEDGSQIAMAVGRDVRERRNAEAERLRLQAQVVEMQKREAIGQLTGGIAHDFNNLLATVLGYCELALGRARPAGDTRLLDHLDAIRIAGERGRDLVTKMLSFARSHPLGAAELPAPLDLRPVIEDSLRLLRATIPTSIGIEFHCDEPLPPVQAERVDIEQIVMNLVINARDAMAGVGQLRLALRGAEHVVATCAACGEAIDAPYVTLCVDDSGPGIPAAIRAQIFQPFYTTKDVGEGTGLGLAVVHGVVHRNGGHIVLGDLDGGTRFEVLLPLAASAAFAREVTDGAAPIEAGQGRHVLVVDDEPMLAEYWRAVLDEVGYRVSVCTDGQSALAAFMAKPADYDAVVSDQTMPGLTGDVLAREVHRQRPGLPFVLCSGYSARLEARNAESLGVSAVLVKPVVRERLLETLAHAFAS